MNVNDYVRTSSGKIAKYLGHEGDKYKFDTYIYWYYEYYNDYVYDEDYKKWLEEEEVKVYKNIIDLIEVGDYVNGAKVVRFKTDENGTKWLYTNDEYAYGYKSNEIKSIITHEQIESMEYKIKE